MTFENQQLKLAALNYGLKVQISVGGMMRFMLI